MHGLCHRTKILALAALTTLGISGRAVAQESSAERAPSPREPQDFMGLLASHGLHDLENERYNLYGQFTWISSLKPEFPARYTNAGGGNGSLLTHAEHSYTGTWTTYFGLRLWEGAEAYYVPEVIAEQPLSNLKGLSAVQNFELQKGGLATPQIYRARSFIKQTFNFGGKKVEKPSGPMQLGTTVESRRFVVSLGSFTVLDFMDKNSFSADLRRQFFNIVFMTHNSYDFASDARGLSWGAVGEFYYDDWAVRFGRLGPPRYPNSLDQEFRLHQFYGDQLELEHDFELWGRPGAIRVLGYRNRENIGRFDDAIEAFSRDPSKNATTCTGYNYGSNNGTAPDLCWARKPNIKVGIGVNLEQHLTEDIGVFFRGMYSDGHTEVGAYLSADRSLSVGSLLGGSAWHRPKDFLGLGAGFNWISSEHARYLGMGGVDGFIGDGRIRQATESVVEAFYSVNVTKLLWLSADVQHIKNPAFNADRGPVDIYGGRVHAEF